MLNAFQLTTVRLSGLSGHEWALNSWLVYVCVCVAQLILCTQVEIGLYQIVVIVEWSNYYFIQNTSYQTNVITMICMASHLVMQVVSSVRDQVTI